MISVIKAFDIYGQQMVQLNVKGNQIHRTNLGGLVGICVFAFILSFIVTRMIKFSNFEDPDIYEVI